MFQKKIDELFSGMPNVFSIADDTLLVGYDEQGREHDEMLEKVEWLCRQSSLNPKALVR